MHTVLCTIINFPKKYQYSCNKSQSTRHDVNNILKTRKSMTFFVSSVQNETALYPSTNLIFNVITVQFRSNKSPESKKSP